MNSTANRPLPRLLTYGGALLFAISPIIAGFIVVSYTPAGLSTPDLRVQGYTTFLQNIGGSCFAIGAVERIVQAIQRV